MPTLEEFLISVCRDVDTCLDGIIPSSGVRPLRLHAAIRWSVFAGGKRFRPALLIAIGETFGAERDRLIHTAAAIEMIHTYSLIHDDLPAMDDDDLRRGRATCHKQFDEATAILAGDVLQTLAFKSVADDATLPAETRIRLVALISTASGTPYGMVAGQQLDLDGEGRELDLDGISTIHHHKTGALISAAAQCGAVIAGAANKEIAAISEYADKLGLLFQITDDLLDATQTTERLGKTAGKDAAVRKSTYVSLLGIENTRSAAARTSDEAREAIGRLAGRNTSVLTDLVDHVANRTK
jgi:geranylgeranyl pyrophosphate synthase